MMLQKLGYILTGCGVLLLILLAIVKVDVDGQAAFLCQKFHENQMNMNECPAHQSNTSWIILAAFGISVLVFGSGVYFLLFPVSGSISEGSIAQERKSYKHIDESSLSEEEKQIYTLIKDKGGSAYQGDLVRETSWGKVKVTRILDKLELANILERKRRGMTNIIVLK